MQYKLNAKGGLAAEVEAPPGELAVADMGVYRRLEFSDRCVLQSFAFHIDPVRNAAS